MPTRNAPNPSQPDWGTFAAIAGTNNWNSIREEKRRELQYVALQNAMQEQEIAKQQAAGTQIQEYFDTVGKLKVLPEGLKRIQKHNTELMGGIQEGIKKHNGNVKKYLLSGGINALNQYKNNLLNAEITQKELVNALNYNRAVVDQQAGLEGLPVSWNQKGQQKEGTFFDQYKAYQSGDTEELRYSGAYKMPNVNFAEEVSKRYKFPDKSKAGVADPRDVYELGYEMGKELNEPARRDYAKKMALQYQQYLQGGGSPYTYKSDQLTPFQKAQISRWSRLDADAKVKQAQDPIGELLGGRFGQHEETSFSNAGLSSLFNIQTEQPQGYTTTPLTFTPVGSNEVKKSIGTAFGLPYGSGELKGKFPKGTKFITATNKQGQTGLPVNLDDVEYEIVDTDGVVTVANPSGGNFNSGGRFMVKMNEDDAENLGIFISDWYQPDRATAAGQGIVKRLEGDNVLISLYGFPQYNPQNMALANHALKNATNPSGILNVNDIRNTDEIMIFNEAIEE